MEYLKLFWHFIATWYWLPLGLIILSTLVLILVENGKPEKTIAWLMVIVFLPVVGVILYYFFGQKFKKDKYFKQLEERYSQQLEEKWPSIQTFIDQEFRLIADVDAELNAVFSYLFRTKNAIPTSNNAVKILINGEQKFPLLFEDLRQAKDHIHLEYYIFEEDEVGTELLNLLVEKAKEGVEVRLIIDGFGSSKLAKRQKYYTNLGIQMEVLLPVHFSSLANSNCRNHRKIVVIDGAIGYVGGINISEKYSNPNRDELYWRDTSIRLAGDAVKMLQIQFWLHWQSIAQQDWALDSRYFPKPAEFVNKVPMSFSFSSPGNTAPYNMEAMILGISAAKKKIELCTPYFIPTESFKTALMIAVSKGVEVSLMIPKKGDSAVVQAAMLSFLKPFVARGVRVFLYEKGFIHAKTINIDDVLAFVGTTNLDSRSFLINFEVSALLVNEHLAGQLAEQFRIDQQDSAIFTFETWQNESWYYKAFASVCRLMAPLL